MKKVLFISSDNNPSSGAFLSMVALARLLKEHHNVSPYVVLPRDGEGTLLLDENQIGHMIIPSYDWVIPQTQKKNLYFLSKMAIKKIINQRAIQSIAAFAKRHDFELIHINTTYAYVGAKAALHAKIPFVWHLREFVEEDQGRTLWNRTRGNKLINKADKIIAISSSLHMKYAPIFDQNRLCKILNGIDVSIFYRPKKTILNDQKIILVYGGGYGVRKGVFELASALGLLLKYDIRNFEWWMIGETNDKFRYHVTKVGLDPYVRYFGYQKNVIDIYEKSDIAFSCSVSEAFGRKTVEAMLAGNLIIASNTGGSLDIVQHDETGLLYKQSDPIDLAHKIIYAMLNKDHMQKVASQGRAFAFQNLSAQLNANHISKVYKEILKKNENKKKVRRASSKGKVL